MENLWANADYANDYLCHLQAALETGFDETFMEARIDQLADLIRNDLYADNNKMYSNSEFEQNLYYDVIDGNTRIYGLLNFVQQRAIYMAARLDGVTLDCPATPSNLAGTLFINEFMADNDSTIEDPDEPGAYEDWIEIFNAGTTTIDLGGAFLSDDLSDPMQWQIPAGVSIAAGEYLLFWADDDEEQGSTHTNFKLGAGGEEIAFYEADGTSEIDSLAFSSQITDVSFGRYPDGADSWGFMATATPGASNDSLNPPPGISGTAHSPQWPTDADPVWVTATVTDDLGVAEVGLTYDAGSGPVAVVMFDDGSHGDGAADDSVYGGQIPIMPEATVVRYYLVASDDLGSETSAPPTAPGVTFSYLVGYPEPLLFINEIMADNDSTIEDPDEPGAYEDWIEIFNAGAVAIDLGAMYLTDDSADPYQWQIPAGVTIDPGAYLLFWADNDDEQGDTHTNFKLSADGEFVGLYESDSNGNVAIDGVVFAAQTTDISLGRCPDGGELWMFSAPTPGTQSQCGLFADGFESADASAWAVVVP